MVLRWPYARGDKHEPHDKSQRKRWPCMASKTGASSGSVDYAARNLALRIDRRGGWLPVLLGLFGLLLLRLFGLLVVRVGLLRTFRLPGLLYELGGIAARGYAIDHDILRFFGFLLIMIPVAIQLVRRWY